ncbi:MAG: phosphatase PAP2 family protein [Phycisphaeraceae bacterium]|nr:phosphatase PAP2 family protein [Phycisphaeraceae bacterium]
MIEHSRSSSALPDPWLTLGIGVVLAFLAVLLVDHPLLPWIRGEEFGRSPLWQRITHIGRSDWFLIASGVAAIIFFFLRVQKPALSMLFAFAAVAATGIAVNVFKVMIGRARPAIAGDEMPWAAAPFSFSGYAYASMPSGHACTSGAIAASLVVLLPRFRHLWWLLAVPVACSRVVVGVHYVSDVILGFALGVAGTRLLEHYWLRYRWFGTHQLALERPRWVPDWLAPEPGELRRVAGRAGDSAWRLLGAGARGIHQGWKRLTANP